MEKARKKRMAIHFPVFFTLRTQGKSFRSRQLIIVSHLLETKSRIHFSPMKLPVILNRSGTVPFYAKAGWVAAWLLVLIFLAMISRNCVSSVIYGKNTAPLVVETYYQQGIIDGSKGGADTMPVEAKENPVLRKAYSKGYRQGIDQKKKK